MQPVDLSTFDASRAWTLREAISSDKLNLRGRRPSLAVVQRWANPRRGCQPTGKDGRAIVLPTVATGRERLTMPEWVDWFVATRTAILVEHSRKLNVPPSTAEVQKRGRDAMKRMGRPVSA